MGVDPSSPSLADPPVKSITDTALSVPEWPCVLVDPFRPFTLSKETPGDDNTLQGMAEASGGPHALRWTSLM